MYRALRHITVVAVIGASMTLMATPAHAAVTPLTIVAVGDSYASGEGAMGLGWLNAACHRSGLAGPQKAAANLTAIVSGTFTSFACSGSTIRGGGPTALLGSGGQFSMLPAGPIDALTVSIGGNDIGFAGLVSTCAIPVVECQTVPSVLSGLTSAFGTLPTDLDAALAAVPTRVRHVFLTEYPDPTTGMWGARCGSPGNPGFQGFDGVSEAEATFASTSVVAPLNAALAAAVTRANAASTTTRFHFVTGIASRFAWHGYCTGVGSPNPDPFIQFNPRYVSTIADSLVSQGDVFGAMHPNPLGTDAIGGALTDAMMFLTRPITMSVSLSGGAIATVPVGLTVTATTSDGGPAIGGRVLIDGTAAGTTNAAGTWSGTWTFASAGTHTVTVDLNPHSTASRQVGVQGLSYYVVAQPSPIPMNTPVAVTLTARDNAMNQPVNGTFTIRGGSGTTTIRSGGSASVNIKMRYEYIGEVDDRGKPIKSAVCPSLTFTPDLPVYIVRSSDQLITCDAP